MRNQGHFRMGLTGAALLAAALPGTAMAQAVDPVWAQSARMGAVNVLKGEALVIAGNDMTYLDRKRGWPRIEAMVRAAMAQLGGKLGGPTAIRIDIEVLEFFGTRGLAANSYNLQLRYTVSEPGGQIISRSGRRNLDRAAGAVNGADEVLAGAVAGDVAAWLSALDCPATVCAPDPAALALAPEALLEAPPPQPAPLPEPAADVVEPPPVVVEAAPAPPPDAAEGLGGDEPRAPEPPSLLARIFLGDAPAAPEPVAADPEADPEVAAANSPVTTSRPVAAPRPVDAPVAVAPAPAGATVEAPAAALPVPVAVADPAPAPDPVESAALPDAVAVPDAGPDPAPEAVAESPSLLTRLFGDPAPSPSPEASPEPPARAEAAVAPQTDPERAGQAAVAPPLIGTPPPARPKPRTVAEPVAPPDSPAPALPAERTPPSPPALAETTLAPQSPAPAARTPVPAGDPAVVTASVLPDPSPAPGESRAPARRPETVQVATALLTAERQATAALAGVVPRPVAPDFALSDPGTLAKPEAPESAEPPPSRPTAPTRVDLAAAPATAAPETTPVTPEVPVSAPVPVVAPAPSVVGIPAITPPPPQRSFFARLFFPDPAPAPAADPVETATADPTAPRTSEITAVAASPLPPASPAPPEAATLSPTRPDPATLSPVRPDTAAVEDGAARLAPRPANPIRVTALPAAEAPEVAGSAAPPGLPAVPEEVATSPAEVARVEPDAPLSLPPAPAPAVDADPRPAPTAPVAVVAPPAPPEAGVVRSGPQPSLATAKWIGSSEVEVSDEKRAGGWMRSGMVTIEAKGWVTDEATGVSAEVVLLPVKASLGDRAQLSQEAMRALGLVPGQIATVSVYLRRP